MIGWIDGIEVGAIFDSFDAMRLAGIHCSTRSGIAGNVSEGATSVVLNEGYIDDEDLGDVVIYTGAGGRDSQSGRQISDQRLTRGNKNLVISCNQGTPVRLIRGYKLGPPRGPEAGYRFDGLFSVISYWHELGNDGYRIYRFKLQKIEGINADELADCEIIQNAEEMIAYNLVSRRIRDSWMARQVKLLYGHRCQVCKTGLQVPGGLYSEGAHIKPLGKPHYGPDMMNNVISLCPNHHVMFDKGAFSVSDNFELIGLEGALNVADEHNISVEYLAYHRDTIFEEN